MVLLAQSDGYIPYDWHYELFKQIFKKITLFNKDYALALHNEGFRTKDDKQKKMKLFNFSLQFKDNEMQKQGIKINKGDTIELVASGYNEIINAILQGLIIDNKFNINNILFAIKEIRNDKKVYFNKINIYKTITPVIESIWNEGIYYLNPYQLEYYNAIKNNLKRKYRLIYNKEYTGELKIQIENILKAKLKTITIKDGYLRGYGKYEILVQADKNMQKVAYYCGLGQNNSMGAGFLNYITGGE